MMRAVLLTVLLVAGCSGGDDPAFTGGPSMGQQCGPTSLSLTSVPGADASLYESAYVDLSGGHIRVVMLPQGTLDLRSCKLNWTGSGPEPSWIITVKAQELAAYPVDMADVRVWSAADEATTGTATIAGYSAEDDTVCGSVSATTPAGTITGSFSAAVYCE